MRAGAGIERTKEEARTRATQALAEVKKGTAFDKVVANYSDEPGAAQRGGKLGRFARRSMVKPFSDAAFALKPGEISGVVETPFGFHVIHRTQ
jgi:parvulin-like peptidyl-prolyl isomerase